MDFYHPAPTSGFSGCLHNQGATVTMLLLQFAYCTLYNVFCLTTRARNRHLCSVFAFCSVQYFLVVGFSIFLLQWSVFVCCSVQYFIVVGFSISLLQWSAFVCCSVQYLLVAVDPHRFTILVFGCKHT